MDRADLIRQLMATFLEELENYISSFGVTLIKLEGGEVSRSEAVPELFRIAHSLKGAARAIGVVPLEQAAHKLEDLLSRVRDGARDFDARVLEVLFDWLEGLELAGSQLETAGELAAGSLDPLLALLEDALNDEETTEGKVAQDLAGPADSHPGPSSPKPSDDIAPPESPVGRTSTGPSVEPSGFGGRSVRVSAQSLDELLDRADELRSTTGGLTSRLAVMTKLRRDLRNWREDWGALDVWLAQQAHGGNIAGTVTLDARQVRTISRMSGRLHQLADVVTGLDRGFTAESKRLERAALLNAESVHDLRMIPFSNACDGLQIAVRNLAKQQGKDASLTVSGAGVAVDRSVISQLKAPLLHLVRNSVDHGIESPAERKKQGKPPKANLNVSAQLRGAEIQIVVEDDGRGVDLNKVRERLKALGRPAPTEPTDLLACIFEAGFSTASEVSAVSGRGVGLDVVQKQLEAIHGHVAIESEPGTGTKFILKTPLTTSMLPLVFVEVEQQPVAIVATNVRRLLRVRRSELVETEGQTYLILDEGQPTPVFSLAEAIGYTASQKHRDNALIMLLAVGASTAAFVVDQFIDQAEALVRSLGTRLAGFSLLAGGTLRPDGSIALVLNAAEVVKLALGRKQELKLGGKATPTKRTHLLVVDDSPTVRTLVGTILEGQGFRVSLAIDGQAAWDLLLKGDVDMVVSDVDMPAMNGIELVSKIRLSSRFENLPVVLVTGRHKEDDRRKGLEAGANAYIVKSAFDQTELLEVIERFV